eukprot:g4754.t1
MDTTNAVAIAAALNVAYVAWGYPRKNKIEKNASEGNGEKATFEFKEIFYVPNVMDYLRVVFLYLAVSYKDYPFENNAGLNFAMFYTISYLLDAFDGMAARALGQTSHLGYYLDMIIDRISSALCLYTASEAIKVNGMISQDLVQPTVYLCYFLIVTVEILAHGLVIYNAEVLGIHQKKMGYDFAVVRLYLDSKAMLFYGCANFELCLLGIIVNQPLVMLIGLPGLVFRAVANLARLWACIVLKEDEKKTT